ncbi:GFA family protein [Spongorhabdus nitratireducens]
MKYKGSCHCSAIQFEFEAPAITRGLRCDCSICTRKAATMTAFTLPPERLKITAEKDALATYTFGQDVARHHFCNRCGIYTFHQTLRAPGEYRINTGCIDGLDSINLPFDIFKGSEL